jgi:hypothetical protein
MKNTNFTTVKTLILRKLEKLRSDPDPNSFGSCSDPEPDPNEHGNQDPDPNKVSSDPQHWDPEPAFQAVLRIRIFYIRIRIRIQHFDNIRIRIQKSQ